MALKKSKELLIIAFFILFVIILHWRWLVSKEVIVSHDTLRFYGIFGYFADSIINGHLPLWNPYMNCGEPFFLNIDVVRSWDPQTIFLILLLKFRLIKSTFLTLYQIDLFIRYLIFIIGGYCFFRYTLKHRISALIAFIVLAFSFVTSTYLRQHGFILVVYLLPWILLFGIKMLEQRNISSYILFAVLLGLAIPAYNSMFLITFLLIFGISVVLVKTADAGIINIMKDYKIIIFSILILILVSLRIIPLMNYFNNYAVPKGRELIPGSTHSGHLDFMGLFLPNYYIDNFYDRAGITEASLYIGLLPLVFVFLGIFYSNNKYKINFLAATVIIMFLMQGIFYPLFNDIIPFFKMIRNMHTFCYFFLFCLCFFAGTGIDVIADAVTSQEKSNRSYLKIPFYAISAVVISLCLVYVKKRFPDVFEVSLKVVYFTAFFAFYSLFSFKILSDNNLGINKRFGVIIFFILIDLFMANIYIIDNNTISKNDARLPSLPKGVQQARYPINRVWEWEIPDDLLNRFAFDGVIYKKHIGNIPVGNMPVTSLTDLHFIELRGYYEFKNSKIHPDVRDIIAGVKSDMLRLISQCVVKEHSGVLNVLENIDKETIENIVLLEEDLPEEFSHLSVEFDKIRKNMPDLGEIKVLDYKENEVLITVDAKQDALLYFSDGYDTYWNAYVDGHKTKIYKANLNFKTIPVKKGYHNIHFLYNPRFYITSIFIYLIAIISIAVLLIFVR